MHWWDKVASLTYFTHFIFVPIVMGALWATSHRQWARFMKRFATVLGVACLLFVLVPTAPPWMVAKNYHLLPPLTAQRRPRLHGDGSARRGGQLEGRTRLGQRGRGHAIAARIVRTDRARPSSCRGSSLCG